MNEEVQPAALARRAPAGARVDSLTTLAPGARIGKYEILSVLGQGGFGITYRAIDSQLDREVAIKEYLPTSFAARQPDSMVLPRSTQLAEDFRWGRDRFLAEAKTLARFETAAGIVNVYDFLEANGTAYMVMGLVRGETLESWLRRERRLSQAAIEQLLHPLLDGLEKVHAANFLHRDIKPANILIEEDGRPTLIDFGASRVALQGRTQAMTAVYTPGYAAFEQFTTAKQGPWTDLYAIGATLYHCITGAPPPAASDRMIEDSLVPAVEAGKGRYAPSLLSAIDAALKLKAGDRPQTIAEFRRAFSIASPSLLAEPPGMKTRRINEPAAADIPSHRPPRRPWLVWLAVCVIVVAGIGGGAFLWQHLENVAKQERADREKTERAEKAARDKVERDKAERERAARDKAEREKAERNKAERDKAERERADREKAERDKVEREKAERDKAEREKADREKAERDKVEREKAERDKAEREKVDREKAERERAERERVERDKAEREKAEQEKAERDKAERERAVRDKAERDRAEKAARDKAERERAEKAARDKAARDKTGPKKCFVFNNQQYCD